ncbi:MAG: hypothetical protein N3J91_07710 [Verrucomicrobiae bacterium]|nr:hypothetical protein [Verrucomicrobiae bacterium]
MLNLKLLTKAWAGIVLLTLGMCDLPAQPRPGDVFREYYWTNPKREGDGFLRVGGKLDYGGGPLFWSQAIDLEQAVRAEVVLEKLLCHDGTRGLAMAVNGHEWLPVPEASGMPTNAWDFQHHTYPVVVVPLRHLRAGSSNFFQLKVAPEHPWNWPQNLIYGAHLRVYYDASRKPHPQGRMLSPVNGEALGRRVTLQAEAQSPNGPVRRVVFVGRHEDVNWEGDGQYLQWHYHYVRGQLTNHLGEATADPWMCLWDTSWVPDQPRPFELAAWITDASGLTYFTPAVHGLNFRRPGLAVELCRPYDVPPRWVTRRAELSQKFRVQGDLRQAVAARLVFCSWSPGYLHGVFINDQKIMEREGPRYAYYLHRFPVPDLGCLRPGENVLKTGFTPKYDGQTVHGAEINWPGIMVLIQYRTPE